VRVVRRAWEQAGGVRPWMLDARDLCARMLSRGAGFDSNWRSTHSDHGPMQPVRIPRIFGRV